MITYSIQPLGALINSGFKVILPLGVQLPHRVGISLKIMDDGLTLCFLKSSINGCAIACSFIVAFFKYHPFKRSFALSLSEVATSMNFPFSFTDSILHITIFNLYCLPRYKWLSPLINFLAGVFG